MSSLLEAAGDARFIFVVGKGGVGKTTAAGAIALGSADAGVDTHLISTDPAHSLFDLFGTSDPECSEDLGVEEFDAASYAEAWLGHALAPVTSIVESGTYLDAEDVAAFSRLALPGVDEMMALLRLTDLSSTGVRVVVDTAPTGHTLRLLDADATHASLAAALRAMAQKGEAVASAMLHATVTMRGAAIIDEMEDYVRRWRDEVLARSVFIVAARPGSVVEAETERLVRGLEQRRLRTAAVVWARGRGGVRTDLQQWRAPWLGDVRGCDGLRAWLASVQPADAVASGDAAAAPGVPPAEHSFADWLRENAPGLLLFAGKGGVGKSTSAAAAAIALAKSRDVLLCSADPAGSLADVLAGEVVPRLRTLQIDPASELSRLRDEYRTDVNAALEKIGLTESAELDRRVIEALWDLTPPGLDELAAVAAMLGEAQPGETIVLDTAPTGHFLRLLETPEMALAWTRQLMRVVVKYGIAGVAAGAAESLLSLARDLKALSERLADADRTGAIIVTLPEPMVRAETARLLGTLDSIGVHVPAVITNRAHRPDNAQRGLRVVAPEMAQAPVGAAALRELAASWNIVP